MIYQSMILVFVQKLGKNEWNLILTDNVKNQSRINHGSCIFGYYKVIHGGVIKIYES